MFLSSCPWRVGTLRSPGPPTPYTERGETSGVVVGGLHTEGTPGGGGGTGQVGDGHWVRCVTGRVVAFVLPEALFVLLITSPDTSTRPSSGLVGNPEVPRDAEGSFRSRGGTGTGRGSSRSWFTREPGPRV